MNKYNSTSSAGADRNDGLSKSSSTLAFVGSPLHNSTSNNAGRTGGLGFNLPQGMMYTLHQQQQLQQQQQQQPAGNQSIAVPAMLMVPQQQQQQHQSAPSVASFPHPNFQFSQNHQSSQPTTNNSFNQFLMALNCVGMPSNNQLSLQGLAGLNPAILSAMAANAQQQQQQLIQQQQQKQTAAAPTNFLSQVISPNLNNSHIGTVGGVAGTNPSSEESAPVASPFVNLAGLGMNPAALQLLQGMRLGSSIQVVPSTTSQSGVAGQVAPSKDQPQAQLEPPHVSTSSVASSRAPHTSSSHSTVMDDQSEPPAMQQPEVKAATEKKRSSESLPPPEQASSSTGIEKGESSSSSLPKTIILPCRARGMPLDHNFRSAHFVIPHNVRHGEDLMCSYEKCRNSGSKFRYCAECRIPVAKRNFHQRHGHGLVCVNTGDSSTSAGTTATATNNPSDSPTLDVDLKCAIDKTPKINQSKSSDPVGSSTGQETSVSTKKRKHQPSVQQQRFESNNSLDPNSSTSPFSRNSNNQTKQQRRMTTAGTTSSQAARAASGSDAGQEFPQFEDIPLSRQLRWATLLGKRPDADDADGMSAWLLEVMTVSDLKHPLGLGGAGAVGGNNLAFTLGSSLSNSSASQQSEMFGDSNNDSSEPMGSSVNSSLSTDLLSSDVSSEEAAQDRRRGGGINEGQAAETKFQKLSTKQINRGGGGGGIMHNDSKDGGDAYRRQEKKSRKSQRGKQRHGSSMNKNSSKKTINTSSGVREKRGPQHNNISVTRGSGSVGEKQRTIVADVDTNSRQEDHSNDSPGNEALSATYAEWQERKKKKALNHITREVEAAAASATNVVRNTESTITATGAPVL